MRNRFYAEFESHTVEMPTGYCKNCESENVAFDDVPESGPLARADVVVRDRTFGARATPVAYCTDILMAERIARLLNDEEVLKDLRATMRVGAAA